MTKSVEIAQSEAPATLAPPNGRQGQKAATRSRVLEAARELFESEGYHGATIREIARRAEVSVGSVFTSFASKGDILSEVMVSRLEALYGELDLLIPHLRGSTVDRLRSLFAIFFAFEMKHMRLFMTHIAAAYDWTLPRTAKPYGANQRMLDLIRERLVEGIEAGDVDAACDTVHTTDLLIAAYAWTYRWALSDGADAQNLSKVMDGHIGLIAQGFAPRPK